MTISNLNYIRTDLASECPADISKGKINGVRTEERRETDCSVLKIEVENEQASDLLGKPVGKYITVSFSKDRLFDENAFKRITDTVKSELFMLAFSLTNQKCKNVLVIGLGNRYVTPDALGPLCIKNVNVTRHLLSRDKKLFDNLGGTSLSAIAPGVTGQTGIETPDMVKMACENVKPDLVICIDALAARSTDRLAATVQLSDCGIIPGSGIGNRTGGINKKTLGVPVIAIGVPTMVDSSTLVSDALEKAGITEFTPELKNVLENGRSFFVTLNDSDIVVSMLSRLISDSINAAFSET